MLKLKLILTAFFAANIAAAKILCIPVLGPIDYAQECIVRRALKHAQRWNYETVLLDIDTPGGRCDNMLKIMDMLCASNLKTVAYVNIEAISAGSFIANVCDRIYFHPNGIMGAAAVINGNGKNLDDHLQAKIDSYLWAKIRTFCEKFPHRYQYQRAMMDKNFVLKAGKTILKPAGELLTLTAKEATKDNPQLPALANGVFDNFNDLAKAIEPEGQMDTFHLSGFERLTQLMGPILPVISGLGFFFLMLEFKTPGFGLMGLFGIGCIALSIGIQYLAGLGGLEAFALLGLGIIALFTDIFILGTFLVSLLGLVLIVTGLWWSGVDIWPNVEITLSEFLKPIPSLAYAVLCWLLLFVIAWKCGLLKSGLNRLTLKKSVAKASCNFSRFIGQNATTTTPLMPSGKISCQGKVLEACSLNGSIPANTPVKIVAYKDFVLTVEELLQK
jgi:Membrane-bound serine protease (ClpP class)